MGHRPGHPTGRPPGASEPVRAPAWLGLALLVAAGLLLAAVVVGEHPFLACTSAVTAASGGVLLAISGVGSDAARRVHLDGAAVTVRMRRSFIVALGVLAVTLTAFFGHHSATEDEPRVRLAGAAAFLLCLASLPDLLRAALTRTHLTFDGTLIRVRSWSTEASVHWADVAGVDGDVSIPGRPAVRILARPEASTLRVRRRRILLPLEPRTPPGQIVVPALAFDEPWLLVVWLSTLLDLPAEDRARVIAGDGTVEFLTGRRP